MPTVKSPDDELKPGRKNELLIAEISQNLTMDDYFAAPGVIAKSELMVEKKFAPANS